MKLLVLMSIEEYSDKMRTIFLKHKVPAYSETELKGYKMYEGESHQDDWFPHDQVPVYSHVLFSFVDDKKADEVLQGIETFSRECDCNNPIRGFVLNVEKSA